MKDELPASATLEEFAQLHRQLLADRVKGDLPKRLHCLELYGMFDKSFKAKKECELDPEQLEAFQRVFDPKAPRRCRWCASAVKPGGAYETYCSDKCHAAANPPTKCRKCGSEELQLVPMPILDLSRWDLTGNAVLRCKACGRYEPCRGTWMRYDPASLPRKRPSSSTAAASSSSNEPAYKSRRRS